MKLRLTILIIILISFSAIKAQESFNTAKPWTYWFWMGNAVDKENISEQLDEMSAAGMGGVHIIPIYGARGWEDKFKSFLSEDWMEMVSFTIKEAGNHQMGVDISLGTGWPFGGAMVSQEDAAKKLVMKEFTISNSDRISLHTGQLKEKFNFQDIVAAYAFNGAERINLSHRLKNDSLDIPVALANWEISLFGIRYTKQEVKRAAPGGEGWVMDYFDRSSVEDYLDHFDSIFSNTSYPISPRAFYHDSYEVYNADWTTQFTDVFKKQWGYEIADHLYVLKDTSHKDYPYIIHDLRATLAGLLYSEFTETWTSWSTEQNRLTRNQAHGSPGNILDLYGLADIPETESFGCSNFDIPGLNCDPDYRADKFGRPSPLMMKFASSPAHLMDKNLVSSETATWLANHFKVSLKSIKPQVDELFISGINHIFYHGTTYSPRDEAYPGWLWYASTNFGRSSHFRDELPLLNKYIENCQKVLQEADPDNDILLYFPIDELWTKYRDKKKGKVLLLLDVHHYDEWFGASSFGKTANWLWDKGYAFDYISDRQISHLMVDQAKQLYLAENSRYKTIIVPAIETIPEATIKHFERLSKEGVKIIFLNHLPGRFPGLKAEEAEIRSVNYIIGGDLQNELSSLDIPHEKLKEEGLDFIRRKNAQGSIYFISNLGPQSYADSLSLSASHSYVTITDPLSGKKGEIKTDNRFFLDLPPGKSFLIQTSKSPLTEQDWHTWQPVDTLYLDLSWEVHFDQWEAQGLKESYQVKELSSWTTWKDRDLKYYTGKATYTSTFSLDHSDGDSGTTSWKLRMSGRLQG